MGESEVRVVEEMFAAWNRRDIEAVPALVAPDAEYVNQPTAVEPGTRHGHEGVADVLRKQWEGLGAGARMNPESLHDRGDHVICDVCLTRPMPASDSVVETRAVLRVDVRDGLVQRMEVLGAGSGYSDGLAAAGIERGPGRQDI
jgi:ketosteroid isomerase-like protein